MSSPNRSRARPPPTELITSSEGEYSDGSKAPTKPITSSESDHSDNEEPEEEVEIFVPPEGEIRNNPKFLQTERYFSRPTRPPYDEVYKREEDPDLEILFSGRIYTNLMTAWRTTGWAEYDKVLGTGGFGSVYLGFRYQQKDLPHSERQLCAIKRIPCYRKRSYYHPDSAAGGFTYKDTAPIWTEVTVMRCLTHAHIVRLGGAHLLKPKIESNSAAYIVMDFCDGGSLADEIMLHEGQVMAIPVARYYFRHVASAIKYMHDKGISHGDLHCSNVLMKYKFDGVCKKCLLADFGLASICWSKKPSAGIAPEYSQSHHVSGRVAFMAPEKWTRVFLFPGDTDPFTISGWEILLADIWNLGNVLCQMVTGTTPMHCGATFNFEGDTRIDDAPTNSFLSRLYARIAVRPNASEVWADEWMSQEFRDPGLQPHPDDPLY